MAEAIVSGARYIARASQQNERNDVVGGAEVRVTFVDPTGVSFDIVSKNGNKPRRGLMAAHADFRENFKHDWTVPANSGWVGTKHFTTRYK